MAAAHGALHHQRRIRAAYCASKGVPYSDAAWLEELLRMCPRDELLLALAAGTHGAGAGGQAIDEWATYVLHRVQPGLAGLLRGVLLRNDGGPPRVFIARQPLLLALKLALVREPPADPGASDPFAVATLLSHFAARETAAYPAPRAVNDPHPH